MGTIRILSVVALAAVLVTAHFALGKQAEWNGLFTLDEVFAYSNRILPNTDIPIKLPLTGIAAVDNYFAFMAAFFWGTLDPRNARAHVQGNHLVGTLGSIWILMLIEAHRGRRSITFLVLTYVFEIFGELLGIGMFTPVWCIFHLLMTSSSTTKRGLSAPNRNLGALGFAIVFGHVVPTYLMIRATPQGEGFASQQWWSVIRLFHPVLVFGFWQLFSLVGSIFFSGASHATNQPKDNLAAIRKFYIFSMLMSAWFHASSLSLLLAPYVLPGWLPSKITDALNLETFFIPVAFWNPEKALFSAANPVPFETGVAIFLQWDHICSASAIVIWATSLYLEASAARKISSVGAKVMVVLQSSLVGLLAGPGAAAAYFLLERDSEAESAVSTETQQKKLR